MFHCDLFLSSTYLFNGKKTPWDAFAFLYSTSEKMARAIFLREGLFFETLALTTENTESERGFC